MAPQKERSFRTELYTNVLVQNIRRRGELASFGEKNIAATHAVICARNIIEDVVYEGRDLAKAITAISDENPEIRGQIAGAFVNAVHELRREKATSPRTTG